MKKDFEIVTMNGSYFDSREEAQRLTALGDAKWDGAKRVKLSADVSKRTLWKPKQSGARGPLVLQLV